jgi:hypothetical protein
MFQGLLGRKILWMKSMGALDSPGYFQAVAGGCRAMFEIAVDVALLHFDPSNNAAKMLAWEDSAKLHAAEKIARFFAGGAVPPAFDGQLGFLATDTGRVTELRARYWGGQHPGRRWTGRDLGRDATAADGFFPEARFAEFYATRYAETCWNTHGSGLAGFRGIGEEMFPGLAAIAMRDAARFAIVAAKIAVQHFGLWDDLRLRFEGVERFRTIAAYAASHGVPFEAVRSVFEQHPDVSAEDALRLIRELEEAHREQSA